MQRWLFLFLRSQPLSLLLGPSDSELSDHIVTSCFVLQVYVCGCFQWSVCGRGVTVTVYKPVEINIVFLQLGCLTGSEPGAITWSESQLWGRETWPQRVKMHFPFFLTELFDLSPQVLSFVSFVCFTASTAAAFMTVPLLEFLAALFLLFAYSTKFNERFKGFHWPLMVRVRVETFQSWMNVHLNFVSMYFQDFMRCVTASIIYFIVSIMAVSRYVDDSSKAAGVNLSSTIVFQLVHFFVPS